MVMALDFDWRKHPILFDSIWSAAGGSINICIIVVIIVIETLTLSVQQSTFQCSDKKQEDTQDSSNGDQDGYYLQLGRRRWCPTTATSTRVMLLFIVPLMRNLRGMGSGVALTATQSIASDRSGRSAVAQRISVISLDSRCWWYRRATWRDLAEVWTTLDDDRKLNLPFEIETKPSSECAWLKFCIYDWFSIDSIFDKFRVWKSWV